MKMIFPSTIPTPRVVLGLVFAQLIALVPMSDGLAADTAAQLKRQADDFASNCINFTLKECNLPNVCGGKSFRSHQKAKRETGNDAVVEERKLKFDGLYIEVLYELEYPAGTRIKNPYKHPFIEGVTITKPNWPVAHGLRVGVTRETVTQVLGKGSGVENSIEYVNDTKQDSVIFFFKNNHVEKIQWTPWNDG